VGLAPGGTPRLAHWLQWSEAEAEERWPGRVGELDIRVGVAPDGTLGMNAGRAFLVVDPARLPGPEVDLWALEPETGLRVPAPGFYISRDRAVPVVCFVQGAFWLVGVVEAEADSAAFGNEDLGVARWDPAAPEGGLVEVYRERYGKRNPGLGTWAGKVNLAWDEARQAFDVFLETPRLGDVFLRIAASGERLYTREFPRALFSGRTHFTPVRDGYVVGDSQRELWYVPVW